MFFNIYLKIKLTMLPRETSIRQLKKLRAETKGTDIGDLTTKDRMNVAIPNMQAIGNPVDYDIESWDEFSKKDSQLQTIAFKSKLVNKPLVKGEKTNEIWNKYSENKIENMKNNVKTFEAFYSVEELDSEDEIQSDFDKIDFDHEFTEDELDELEDEIRYRFSDDDDDDDDLDENVKTFEAFSVKPASKEEKQPEYTLLGKEKEPKSNPNFGIGAVKAQEIKKITDFNVIDPKTPKERTIGGNSGVFVDNEKVKGYINRIEGKDVYIESLDEPLVIKKFSLKDVVKTNKEKE